MKKIFFYATASLVLAGCASDEIVDVLDAGQTGKSKEIHFTTNQKNITRSYSKLQDAGHYNFGVFGYKSTDKENNIMANYLVGYSDETNKKGYKFGAAQTTQGDAAGLEDGKSMWQYEGLGYSEYQYSGNDFYNSTTDTKYMSNVDKQYLRYWDKSAPNTHFIAYAPYINDADASKRVQYVDGTAVGSSSDAYVLTFPNGVITDGYDNEALSEYMWASTNVAAADYGHDVALQFKRLNAKVNIKFWEDIPGYNVRILDLGGNKNYEGVQAAPAIKNATHPTVASGDTHTYGEYGYAKGKYYRSNGAKIQFDANAAYQGEKQYQGTLNGATDVLQFASPADAQIGENRFAASASPTTYYAIPKSGTTVMDNSSIDYSDATVGADADLALTGFTFHVSYELTSTTGERIVVRNATVHVPAAYCKWDANTHYTYIFKITKNSNGTTAPDDPGSDPTNPNTDIDPTDPEVPTVQGLYPIVFDNCTVVDWTEEYNEWEITEGTTRAYHDVKLLDPSNTANGKYSLVSGDIRVEVTDNDTHASHTIDYSKVTVNKLGNATVLTSWYTNNTTYGTITVPATAAAGVYVVTYTCNAPAEAHATHPNTWTETFVVGNAYEITTHQQKIGTYFGAANGSEEAKLNISVTKNNFALIIDPASVEIVYPENIAAAEKNYVGLSADGEQVVVKSNAKPGIYKVIYKVDEGSVVKVDDYDFEVVDYRFTLSEDIVYLNAASKTVTANVPAGVSDGVISMTSMPSEITLSGNVFTITNACAEDTYTVTYTVDGATPTNVAKTVYTKTFVVKNAHAVALNKTTIDRNEGATGTMTFGTDKIVITTTKNAVTQTTDQSSSLKVVNANGVALTATTFYDATTATAANTANQITDINGVAPGNTGYIPTYNPGFPVAAGDIQTVGDYKITFNSSNKNELQVNKALAAGTYKVVYTQQVSGSPVEEVATFVVTE